jgi:high affinity Mn2+ porin
MWQSRLGWFTLRVAKNFWDKLRISGALGDIAVGMTICRWLVCVGCAGLCLAPARGQDAGGQEAGPKSGSAPVQTSGPAAAPAAPGTGDAADSSDSDVLTLFPHSESSRFWVSGQANVILQWHPGFPAAYSGRNSFGAAAQNATSKTETLYTGLVLTPTTEVFLDVEETNGHGLSEALGLAGFVNLDVVRNPSLGVAPYLARFMLRQIIPLSSDRMDATRGIFGLATSLPARRLELRMGKFSLVDFFDLNSGGSDSHLQFLNWAVDNNGAYDYAANTRGYTDGALVEYDDHGWSVRFAETLMPKVANGIHLDADVARARAENLEFELRKGFLRHREGTVRVLSYVNHADMGNYRQAIDNFLNGLSSEPDIVATRKQGRKKYGFGLNFEQELTSWLGVFGRAGWSDGRNESFAYTEIDRTGEIGEYFDGKLWRRKKDRAGTVFEASGLSADHRTYLADGGLGFLLGDGALTYGREKIFEAYYTGHLWRGFFASFDVQHINNPGYNQARGPVVVPGVRLHVEF